MVSSLGSHTPLMPPGVGWGADKNLHKYKMLSPGEKQGARREVVSCVPQAKRPPEPFLSAFVSPKADFSLSVLSLAVGRANSRWLTSSWPASRNLNTMPHTSCSSTGTWGCSLRLACSHPGWPPLSGNLRWVPQVFRDPALRMLWGPGRGTWKDVKRGK